MPEEERGQAGISPLGLQGDGLHVPDQGIGVVSFAEKAQVGGGSDGSAVTGVIVARDGKSPLRQVRCEILIAADVLRHSVGDLQNGPGLSLRLPQNGMDRAAGGGRQGQIFTCHGALPPSDSSILYSSIFSPSDRLIYLCVL